MQLVGEITYLSLFKEWKIKRNHLATVLLTHPLAHTATCPSPQLSRCEPRAIFWGCLPCTSSILWPQHPPGNVSLLTAKHSAKTRSLWGSSLPHLVGSLHLPELYSSLSVYETFLSDVCLFVKQSDAMAKAEGTHNHSGRCRKFQLSLPESLGHGKLSGSEMKNLSVAYVSSRTPPTHKKCLNYCLFSFEMEREWDSINWYTPQMPAMAGMGQDWHW